MHAKAIKKAITNSDYQPMIISYADSNHYLAGVEDKLGKFHCLTEKNNKIISFNSILEAEKELEKLGAKSAKMLLDTAYDEMVGSEKHKPCSYEVKFCND